MTGRSFENEYKNSSRQSNDYVGELLVRQCASDHLFLRNLDSAGQLA